MLQCLGTEGQKIALGSRGRAIPSEVFAGPLSLLAVAQPLVGTVSWGAPVALVGGCRTGTRLRPRFACSLAPASAVLPSQCGCNNEVWWISLIFSPPFVGWKRLVWPVVSITLKNCNSLEIPVKEVLRPLRRAPPVAPALVPASPGHGRLCEERGRAVSAGSLGLLLPVPRPRFAFQKMAPQYVSCARRGCGLGRLRGRASSPPPSSPVSP